LLSNFNPIKNQENKNTTKKEKKSKNTRGYTWRKSRRLPKLVMNDQNDKWKIWRTRTYKIEKISNPILIAKDPFGENIFIWGKGIQFGWVRT